MSVSTPDQAQEPASGTSSPPGRETRRPVGRDPGTGQRWSMGRWILTDLGVAVVLAGGIWAGIAVTHGTTTGIASQSALVEASLSGIQAPTAGMVVSAPSLALGAVRPGEALFAIRTPSGVVTDVRSPLAGQVASLGTTRGAMVTAGQTLATITPAGRFRVVAMVSEDEIRKVKVGDRATIRLPEDPGGRFTGRVLGIWPQSAQTYLGSSLLTSAAAVFIKQTQLLPVVVSLPFSPHGIAAGESAEVTIHVANG